MFSTPIRPLQVPHTCHFAARAMAGLLLTLHMLIPAQAAPKPSPTPGPKAPVTEYSGNAASAKQHAAQLNQLVCGGRKTCAPTNIRVLGDFALVSWLDGDAGGMDLFRHQGKSWKLLQLGGGAVGVDDAVAAGVPRAEAEMLMPMIWFENLKAGQKLKAADLETLTGWELLVLRNSIYARHGRPFGHARLKRYFASWPWYKVNPKYSDKLLSAADRANISTISAIEKRKGFL